MCGIRPNKLQIVVPQEHALPCEAEVQQGGQASTDLKLGVAEAVSEPRRKRRQRRRRRVGRRGRKGRRRPSEEEATKDNPIRVSRRDCVARKDRKILSILAATSIFKGLLKWKSVVGFINPTSEDAASERTNGIEVATTKSPRDAKILSLVKARIKQIEDAEEKKRQEKIRIREMIQKIRETEEDRQKRAQVETKEEKASGFQTARRKDEKKRQEKIRIREMIKKIRETEEERQKRAQVETKEEKASGFQESTGHQSPTSPTKTSRPTTPSPSSLPTLCTNLTSKGGSKHDEEGKDIVCCAPQHPRTRVRRPKTPPAPSISSSDDEEISPSTVKRRRRKLVKSRRNHQVPDLTSSSKSQCDDHQSCNSIQTTSTAALSSIPLSIVNYLLPNYLGLKLIKKDGNQKPTHLADMVDREGVLDQTEIDMESPNLTDTSASSESSSDDDFTDNEQLTGAVFGGGDLKMKRFHEVNAIRPAKSQEGHFDVRASVRVQDAPSPWDEKQPFEEIRCRLTRHDLTAFKNQMRSQEKKVNREKIEALSDPIPLSNLTTPANHAEVARNRDAMFQRSRCENTHHPSTRSRWQESLNFFLSNEASGRKIAHEDEEIGRRKRDRYNNYETNLRRSRRQKQAQESMKALNVLLDLMVYKDPKQPDYKLKVKAEPYLKANHIAKKHWTEEVKCMIQERQPDLVHMTRKDQLELLKELVESRTDLQHTMMPTVTEDEMKVYESRIQPINSSDKEGKSAKETISNAAPCKNTLPNFEISQQIADIIMQGVRNAMLPLAVPPNDLTKPDGNCFFHTLVSQLQRPEVNPPRRFRCLDHVAMRKEISKFMMTSKLPCVNKMRQTWTDFNLGHYNTYWTTMMNGADRVWAEGPVIQAAAWYLQRDIYIVSEQATIDKPMISFSGNCNSEKPCSGANLWLGFYTGGHYQTLNLEQSQIDFQPSNLHHQSVQETLKATKKSKEKQVVHTQNTEKRDNHKSANTKTGKKGASSVKLSKERIKQLGVKFNMSMTDVLSNITQNRPLNLRVGENIFCTEPKEEDMLCSVHSVVTSVLNIDSIRHMASQTNGDIGEALSRITTASSEEEKYHLIKWLARELSENKPHPRQGRDAGVIMNNLLASLFSERPSSALLNQHVEITTMCKFCNGERKEERLVVMSMKSQQEDKKVNKVCIQGPECGDGDIYNTRLLNSPDTFIQMVPSRRKTATYNQSEEVPYLMQNENGSAEYDLKFCIVHLGDSPESGHFVSLFSNPLDRSDCLLVDNGTVKTIKREYFEQFAKKSYLIGYERTEPACLPNPTAGEISTRTDEARKLTIRRVNALESLDFLRTVQENIKFCEDTLEESYQPKETKKAFLSMLRENTCILEPGEQLKEEKLFYEYGLLLHKHLTLYEQSPWSFYKTAKYKLGLYEDADCNGQVKWFENMIRRKMNIKSQVRGTGNQQRGRLLENAELIIEEGQDGRNFAFRCKHCGTESNKTDMLKHIDHRRCIVLGGDAERIEEGSSFFRCTHCRTEMEKEIMEKHRDHGRCKVLRNISAVFKISPRQIARGCWSNPNWRVHIIRSHNRGNITGYTLEERGTGNSYTCHVKTKSTTDLNPDHNNGTRTTDGYAWPGRGYAVDNTHLVSAREEIMYRDIEDEIPSSSYFPIWRVFVEVSHIKDSEAEVGEVNLGVHAHPAQNLDNREREKEFQLILVASEDGPPKMVLRQPKTPDEELTSFEPLRVADENLGVNEDIINEFERFNIQACVGKGGLPEEREAEPKRRQPVNANILHKFENPPKEMLCWFNGPLQVFNYITRAYLERELRTVMNQPTDWSGIREVPKMLLDIICRAGEVQKLDKFRTLLIPEVRNANRTGPALRCLETLVDTLKKQAPSAVEGFESVTELEVVAGPCPTEGCDGNILPDIVTRETSLLNLDHNRIYDGHSVQNLIDRNFNANGRQHSRTCTNQCHVEVQRKVNFKKRPDIFLVTVNNRSVDQQTSMEVMYGGARYKAVAVIHHLPGSVGHHYCSLWNEETKEWLRVDDFHGQENWKLSYRNDEGIYKVGSDKLFDNLGHIVYKLKPRQDNNEEATEEPEAREEDNLVNFHTATHSGQQLLLSSNKGKNECYANSFMAMLLGNPYMQHFARTLAGRHGATAIERFLQRLCHCREEFRHMQDWRTLIKNETIEKTEAINVPAYDLPIQQDSMEFGDAILKLLDTEDGQKNGQPFQAPLSAEHRHALRNILGFTSTMTTVCTEPGCSKRKVESAPDFVFRIPVDDDTLTGCIEAALQPQEPHEVIQCETCFKRKGKFQQTQSINGLKKCIIIQLKRFKRLEPEPEPEPESEPGNAEPQPAPKPGNASNPGYIIKIDAPVTIEDVIKEGPLEGYVLTGAVLHHGSTPNSGHYTHILRDIVSQTWFETNDSTYKMLREETAMTRLRDQGYIFFYSKPDEFPPPMKGVRRKAPGARRFDQSRKGQGPRRFFSTSSSTNFQTSDDVPLGTVRVPHIPLRQRQAERRPTHCPSEDHIRKNIEANPTNTNPAPPLQENDRLAQLLTNVFKHTNFRSREQLDATKALIDGNRDVMVFMSTGKPIVPILRPQFILLGSGKSLTYQLATLMRNQISIVVEPTLSLARDQVTKLNEDLGMGEIARLVSYEVITFPAPFSNIFSDLCTLM